jgi:hypothetical protein
MQSPFHKINQNTVLTNNKTNGTLQRYCTDEGEKGRSQSLPKGRDDKFIKSIIDHTERKRECGQN